MSKITPLRLMLVCSGAGEELEEGEENSKEEEKGGGEEEESEEERKLQRRAMLKRNKEQGRKEGKEIWDRKVQEVD